MTALPTLKLRVLPTFPSSVISNGTLTITKTAGVYTIAIATAGVSFANMQSLSASRLMGNPTVVLAPPSEISVGATLTFTGSALQTLPHTGDVTAPINSFVTTVAKIQGTTVSGTTGTGTVVFSDSPNFTTSAVLFRNANGAAYADGLVAINQTAAAAGAQQFSPAIRLSGQGWRTNATAQTEQVDWTFINEAVQGAADPASNLSFNFQVNSGGYAQKFRMGSGGVFNALTGYTVNGAAASGNVLRGNGTNFVSAQLAAADLSDTKTGSGSVVLATSPTLVTPVLGAATGTSLTLANGTANGLTLTAASGTNASIVMAASGNVFYNLGSATNTFFINDSNTNSIFTATGGSLATAFITSNSTLDATNSTTAGLVSSGGLAVAKIVNAGGAVAALTGTAIPAGGTAAKGFMFSSTANFGIFFGSGAPSLAAAKGSMYLRSDGSTTNNRAYINTDGSTTWTALTTVA